MSTVVSIGDPVNSPTPEHASHWIEQKGASGEIKQNTARLWASAIAALAQCLRDDEPHDASYMCEHLDELGRRWANLHQESRGETAKTYESRARSALGAFLAWRANPSGFRFPVREVAPRVPSRPAKEARATEAPAANGRTDELTRVFPLGADRSVRFQLPPDFDRRDVMRFACHLLTLAQDFDPTDATQTQLFALARQQT